MNTIENEELSALLIEALDAAGSTPALAAALGVSPRTVRFWVNGATPGASSVRRLLGYMGRPWRDAPEEEDVATLVADAVERAGSQGALAALLGVSAMAVSGWSRGGNPSEGNLSALAEFVGQAPPEGPLRTTHKAKAAVKGEPSPLEQLKRWVRPDEHPGWLVRAVTKAKGRGSLRAWLGKRREGEGYVVDDRRAAERVWKTLQLEPPPGARDLLLDLGAKLQTASGWEPPRRKGKYARSQEGAENPNTRLVRLRRERMAREADQA